VILTATISNFVDEGIKAEEEIGVFKVYRWTREGCSAITWGSFGDDNEYSL
jgi:hypothetical protein